SSRKAASRHQKHPPPSVATSLAMTPHLWPVCVPGQVTTSRRLVHGASMEHDAAGAARAPSLKRYAWLSIAAAVATIALKGGAWLITDSVGLLSDAVESVVNLVAAVVALYALAVAERPADEEHEYGHTKVEY